MPGVNGRYRRGLVVGKFCPLHLGHEWLISQAWENCSELIVLSYTEPGFVGYEAARREQWLKARFPDIRVLVIDAARLAIIATTAKLEKIPPIPADKASDDDHRYFVAWLCMQVLRTTVDAVFTSEDYGDGFAKTLARCFSHPVDHVCVDKARARMPVSGSMIRANLHTYRKYLSPEVYASFVRRIAILGGESTGKTTFAAALAKRLNTLWVPEFGRDLWEAKAGCLEYDDMLLIAKTQIAREESLAGDANGWLVCDTTPLTTLFYCEAMFGQLPAELCSLALRDYDLTLVCMPDFEFVQDGTRRDDEFRSLQHAWYLTQLSERTTEFRVVSGDLMQRLAVAESLIAPRT